MEIDGTKRQKTVMLFAFFTIIHGYRGVYHIISFQLTQT